MNYRRVFIENGYVHLIIVAYNRHPIFVQNINLLKQAIINSKKYFNYELIAICVLPEHIHMIIYPENIKDYPKIITSIKYYFSHNIDVGVETPTYKLSECCFSGHLHTCSSVDGSLHKQILYPFVNYCKYFSKNPKVFKKNAVKCEVNIMNSILYEIERSYYAY